MRKETKWVLDLVIMRKVKWTLIEFADLHGKRHSEASLFFLQPNSIEVTKPPAKGQTKIVWHRDGGEKKNVTQ
jgi:hypothetical protein